MGILNASHYLLVRSIANVTFEKYFGVACKVLNFFISVYVVDEPFHQLVHRHWHVVQIMSHQLLVISEAQQTTLHLYQTILNIRRTYH